MGIIVLVGLAFQAGGYFPPAYLAAGSVVYATLAVIVLVRPSYYSFSTEALVGLVALTALAVWTGLSSGWSPSPDAGLETMQRNFFYVGLFGLGLLAAGSGRLAKPVVWGVGAAIILIVGAAVMSRLYPHLVPSPRTELGYRLAYPLTYWNALGALAAMGVTLMVALAADARTNLPARAASAAVSVMMATGLYLTLSRGGFLALFAGAVLLLAVFPRRISLLLSILVVAACTTLAIVRLGHYQALTEAPKSGDAQASAGARYGPQLLIWMASAALLQAGIAVAQRWSRGRVTTRLRKYKRPVLVGLVGVVAIGALAFYALNRSGVEGRVSATSGFAQRQWHLFLGPTAAPPGMAFTPGRLTTAAGSGRREVWEVALRAFEDHPIRGQGAGSFEFRRTREGLAGRVRNAHSLYLETLGELGLVGLALLAAFIVSLVVAAVRARRRNGALDTPLAAGVVAACAVWLVHAAVDWDWQVSALSGLAIMLAATLYPRGRGGGRARARARPRASVRRRGDTPLPADGGAPGEGAPRS